MNAESEQFSDAEIELKVAKLSGAIEAFARERGLWHDCGFTSWLQRHDDEPTAGTPLLVMWADGPMRMTWDGDATEQEAKDFRTFLEGLGYWYECYDGATIHLHPEDDALSRAFDAYARWQWICSLVKPDIADVHEEIYGHFASCPEDLHRLKPRQFEILLSRVFQSQGFTAELGPGRDDGGVDVRLWHRDPIGEIVTLVQAKRYAKSYAIEQDAVAALSGVVHDQNAGRGLFVTTSRYLPSAREFAARQRGRIALADSQDVAAWCADAASCVVTDKSRLVTARHVEALLEWAGKSMGMPVVHAHTGYTNCSNSFCLVLKESRHAALLMRLPKRSVSGNGWQGEEVPVLDSSAALNLKEEAVFRVRRRGEADGRISYWGGGHLYAPWNGKPQYFDHFD